MEVRLIEPAEYDAAAGLTLRAYLAGVGAPEPYRPHLLDVAGRAASSEVLVAVEEGGRVVGTVTYVPRPGMPESEFDDPAGAGMRMLAVEPSAQGRGVGKALVDACVTRARAAGRRRLIIHTRPEMAAARRIYEATGFRRDPAGDFVPLPGVVLECFMLELDGPARFGADR